MIKKNKVFIILIFTTMFCLLFCNSVKAVSANISASKTNVGVGDKVIINVNWNAASWRLNVEGAVSGKYANASEDGNNTNMSKTLYFTPTKPGSYTISLTGDISDGASNQTTLIPKQTITIVASDKATASGSQSQSQTTQSSAPASTEKSNVAALSNLGIKPNDFTGFNKNKTSYNVEVPYETEKVSVYATAANNGKVTSGTGNKTLQVGANAVNVVVTAEDGKTTKTYTLNIVRKEQEVKEENTISEGNVVENIENNIDANTLLEGNVENSIEEPSNDVSNQLLISTKDDSKIKKKLISDCIIGVAFAIIILLLIIYYTTQYNKDEDFEEQEDNTNSVEPEEEKSKKEEINKEANKNETINVDIEVPKKHQKGKRFK